MKARARVLFTGRVQGVWFRANTREKARELCLTGRVRNLPDGRVEAVFEGERADIETVIDWCCTSQPLARVDHAEVEWKEHTGKFSGFEITR